MIPAGRSPLRSIFLRCASINSKISDRRASIMPSNFFLETAGAPVPPVLTSSASSKEICNPSAISFVISFEPIGKTSNEIGILFSKTIL